MLPCDLDCSVSVNSTLDVTCLFPLFASSLVTFIYSKRVKLEVVRTDPVDSHEKHGLCPDALWLCQSSPKHTLLVSMCQCFWMGVTGLAWLWLPQQWESWEVGWGRNETAFIWGSAHAALTLFVGISWTCNDIKNICQTSFPWSNVNTHKLACNCCS